MRNGFCFLTDNLPCKVRIGGHTAGINTDTASCMSVILYLQDSSHNAYEKCEYTVMKLLKDFPCMTFREILEYLGTTEEVLAGVLFRFLQGYPQKKSYKELQAEKNSGEKAGQAANSKPTFDYVQDSDLIVGAFRQSYGMSLAEIRELHWWEFLALFNALPEGSVFHSVRQIRSMKINPKDSAQRKQEIREAKRAVALKDARTPEQKRADLQRQFNNLEL